MILIVGIKHDLQWKWNYDRESWTPHSLVDIATKVYEENLRHYLPWLEDLIDKNRVEIVGEEAGAGMFLEELLKEHNCQLTFLQEIANQRSVKYFRFDLPRDQLSRFGIKPELADYKRKEQGFSCDERMRFFKEREKWFHKKITSSIRKEQNGLVILGAKHLRPLELSLQQSGYEVVGQDVTCFEWYKDPTDEAHRCG
jgi:hypothetical protein